MLQAEFDNMIKSFLEIRSRCGNALPKTVNPTENVCLETSSGFCSIGECPLLEKGRQAEQLIRIHNMGGTT